MTAPTTPSPSASAQIERKLAADAYRKAMAGETLSVRERSALKKLEKDQEEKRRWQYYGSIPQKHWRKMSGRQTKVLNEQAALYSLPFGGPIISLPDVVRALHDFLATHAQRLANDPLLQGDVASPALERYREERAALARLDRLEREGTLVLRHELLEGLGRIASLVRTAGETLQRQYGPGAADVLNEAVDDAEREISRMFEPPPSADQVNVVDEIPVPDSPGDAPDAPAL